MKNIHVKYPMSWSQLSSWEYDQKEWYRRYVLLQKGKENDAMRLGKDIGEKLASVSSFMPEVPRLSIFEQPLSAKIGDIPLVGYADSYEPKKALKEYKTGVREWTQSRVDNHGQIDMYLLMLYLSEEIHPEDIECQLIWLPTYYDYSGNLEITGLVHIFDTKRSMVDILRFGQYIQDTVEKMKRYIDMFAKTTNER